MSISGSEGPLAARPPARDGVSAILHRYQEVIKALLDEDECPGASAEEFKQFRNQLGASTFTCRLQSCPRASFGFSSAALCHEHEIAHVRQYKCTYQDCKYPPLTSAQSLKNHLKTHNQGNIRRSAIRRNLSGPVTIHDGIQAERELAMDDFDFAGVPGQGSDSEQFHEVQSVAAAAAGAAQQPQESPMFQPLQMRSFPLLNNQEKQECEHALRRLWHQANCNPADSERHHKARKAIADFSRMLTDKINYRKRIMMTQHAASLAQRAAAAATAQQPQAPSAQQHLQAGSNAGAQQAGAPAAGAATGQDQADLAPASRAGKLPDHIMAQMAKMTFHPPPDIRANPELAEKWVYDTKQKYARSLLQMENTKSMLNHIGRLLQMNAARGGDSTNGPELWALLRQREMTQAAYADAMRFVENFHKTQVCLAEAAAGTATTTAAATKAQANGGATAIPTPAVGVERTQAQLSTPMDEVKEERPASTGTGGPARIGFMALQPTQSYVSIPVTADGEPATPIQQTPASLPIPGDNVEHPSPVNTALTAAASPPGVSQPSSEQTVAPFELTLPDEWLTARA